MKKSRVAFEMTCDRLFSSGKRIYFWTVTFSTLHNDWECAKLWTSFLNHLRQVVGRTGWGGVRVTELHGERGVHYHFLCTERLAVDLVRRVGRCHGIGRIHVAKADRGAGLYLSKYLSKQHEGAKTESGGNARRWAVFGDVDRVRVRDLVNYSDHWQFRRQHQMAYLGFVRETIAQRAWSCSDEAEFSECYRLLAEGMESHVIAFICGQMRSHRLRNGGVVLVRVPLCEPGSAITPGGWQNNRKAE